MLAFFYLAVFCVLGDFLCRRFFPIVSTPHRIASAFLAGLLVSSWLTYLAGLLFAATSSPLLWGNIGFFIVGIGAIVWLWRSKPDEEPATATFNFETADAAFIIAFTLMATWLMFSTFASSDGMLRIGYHEFFDFGQTLSIQQSFGQGANFPTHNPHYAGELIRSYFLFYFQAGNLEYLGLDPAWSNNLLSILSMSAMLILVMTLGRVLFDSPWAGRIGALLFFFHGSLSFYPFLKTQASISGLIEKLSTITTFLNSGLQLKGEDWGVWTQNVFVTQRNLTSAIGLLLVVLVFVVIRLRQVDADKAPDETHNEIKTKKGTKNVVSSAGHAELKPYIFCGIILGLLPMWNGAVLIPGLVVIGILVIIFDLKRELLIMLAITAIIAVPQLIYLKLGAQPASFSCLHWAYLFDNPSIFMVLYFLSFTFGFKWLLIGLGLKYSGRISVACNVSAKPTRINSNHSGEDR